MVSRKESVWMAALTAKGAVRFGQDGVDSAARERNASGSGIAQAACKRFRQQASQVVKSIWRRRHATKSDFVGT